MSQKVKTNNYTPQVAFLLQAMLKTGGGSQPSNLNIARQRSAPSGILFKSGSRASKIGNFMIFIILIKFVSHEASFPVQDLET